MALNGNFRETPFADLLQFYSVSKQTVAVAVRLGAADRVDGVFYFTDGDLVGATLAGLEGREAVRRALRLREGLFTVEIGVGLPDPAARQALRSIVMEEVIRLDEENRVTPQPSPLSSPGAKPGGAKHSGAVAAGAAWFAAPEATPVRPPGAAGTPAAAARRPAPPKPPALQAQATTGSTPKAIPVAPAQHGPPPPVAPPPRRAPSPPAQPPPARRGRIGGIVALLAVGTAAVLAFVAWYLVSNREALAPANAVAGPRGVLDDAVVLGMVASFTGSNKERGRAMRLGWEMAIAEVNEAGGIHGRKLRLVAYDDGYDPARTGPAMKEVIDGQGAFAIVGNVGTATAAVAVPFCAEKGAVFYGALSGADLLRKTPPDRHVFNFRAGLAAEAAAAVRYLVDVRRLQAKRIAILAQDDDFGRSGQRGALKQLQARGIAEADVLKLTYPRNTADVRDAIATLRQRSTDVDAVVMVATYKPAATFVRKAKESKLSLFYTTVSADSNGLAEELVVSGQGYTENVLLTQVVPVPTSPASTLMRYRKALERWAPGEKPGSTSLEAWIGAQIFIEALKRAGRELDTAKLIASLEAIQSWDIGIGGAITFGPADHQGSDMVFGWLLQPDGSYQQVELE